MAKYLPFTHAKTGGKRSHTQREAVKDPEKLRNANTLRGTVAATSNAQFDLHTSTLRAFKTIEEKLI